MTWSDALLAVSTICSERDVKLTQKRRSVFAALVQAAPFALSAYDVVDRLRAAGETAMQPVSVYRMLDVLIERRLVHRLASNQKFLACSHLVCAHDHELPQFLICTKCQKICEVGISNATIDALRDSVAKADFILNGPQLELYGVCGECQRKHAA